jgi:hypothetical protein
MEECSHNRIKYGNAVRAQDGIAGIEYVGIPFHAVYAGDNPVAVTNQRVVAGKRDSDNQQDGIQAENGTKEEKQVKQYIGPIGYAIGIVHFSSS